MNITPEELSKLKLDGVVFSDDATKSTVVDGKELIKAAEENAAFISQLEIDLRSGVYNYQESQPPATRPFNEAEVNTLVEDLKSDPRQAAELRKTLESTNNDKAASSIALQVQVLLAQLHRAHSKSERDGIIASIQSLKSDNPVAISIISAAQSQASAIATTGLDETVSSLASTASSLSDTVGGWFHGNSMSSSSRDFLRTLQDSSSNDNKALAEQFRLLHDQTADGKSADLQLLSNKAPANPADAALDMEAQRIKAALDNMLKYRNALTQASGAPDADKTIQGNMQLQASANEQIDSVVRQQKALRDLEKGGDSKAIKEAREQLMKSRTKLNELLRGKVADAIAGKKDMPSATMAPM